MSPGVRAGLAMLAFLAGVVLGLGWAVARWQ